MPASYFSLFLVFYAGMSICTLFWTPVPGYTQSMLWRQGSLLLMFAILLLSPEEEFWPLIKMFLWLMALAVAGTAVGQYCVGEQPEATFLNKNSLAGYLMPLLFWALYRGRHQRHSVTWLSFVLLFTGGLVLGLIGSRGALLALAVGVACALLLTRYARLRFGFWWRQGAYLGAGLLTSLLITGVDVGGGLGRLGTLQDPWNAGSSRFVIWKSSWDMLQDSPWYGRGAGIYGLAYPQYRQAVDKSAGHFAHNDLLQIGIEIGWSGVALCLLIAGSATVLVLRSLRRGDMSEARKQESLLLWSGVVAVLFHSLFTFHLYVYVTLLVVGTVMARWYLLMPRSEASLKTIELNRYGRWMKHAPATLCLVPLFWLMTGGLSQIATQQAMTAVAADDTGQAVTHLQTAQRWWPSNDFNWYMTGEVIRLGLRSQHQDDSRRGEALSLARESFEMALQLNPLRAAAAHKFALLLVDNAQQLSAEDRQRIVPLLTSALRIDPRYFPARIDLARYFAAHNAHDQAQQVLEDGLKNHYRNVPALIPYLQLAATYREAENDSAGAEELQERIREIKNQWEQGNHG